MSMETEAPEQPRPGGLLGRYVSVVERLCRLAYTLAAVLVLMDLVLIGGSVVLRYFFSSALVGADEIVAFSLTAVVMLAAPEVLRRNHHVAVDVVVALLPPRAKKWTEIWAAISVLAVALLLIVNGYKTVLFSRMIGSLTEGQLEWPVWMLQSFLPLGGVLLGLVAIEQLWRTVASMRNSPLPQAAHQPNSEHQQKTDEPSPADSL